MTVLRPLPRRALGIRKHLSSSASRSWRDPGSRLATFTPMPIRAWPIFFAISRWRQPARRNGLPFQAHVNDEALELAPDVNDDRVAAKQIPTVAPAPELSRKPEKTRRSKPPRIVEPIDEEAIVAVNDADPIDALMDQDRPQGRSPRIKRPRKLVSRSGSQGQTAPQRVGFAAHAGRGRDAAFTHHPGRHSLLVGQSPQR